MTKPFLRLLHLAPVLVGSLLGPGAALFACATDNGDAVHGTQFGPTPQRPDGSTAVPPEAGEGEETGPLPEVEGGQDSGEPPDAEPPPPACTTGTVAVLAGGEGALTGAVQIAGGAWSGAAIAGGAAKSRASIVAFGPGFLALTRGPSDALQSLTYGTGWGAPVAVGTATTLGAPALTVLGAKAHAVFLSGPPQSNKFFRAENEGTTWNAGTEPVSFGGAQSFGPSAAALAAAGGDVVLAQDGSDNGLYVQTWNGAWKAGAPILGAGTFPAVPPALAAVDGKHDLVLLYADNTVNHVIGFATRDRATKAWSTAAVTNPKAQTSEQLSLARISATTLLATFRGNDQRPYYMAGTLGANAVTWSTPAALLGDTSKVDTAPAVAPGVCGDDAIAVFAAGGQVKASRFRGGAWSAPEAVTGTSGSQVAVATR